MQRARAYRPVAAPLAGAAALMLVQAGLLARGHVLAGQLASGVLVLTFANVAALRPGSAAAWRALALVGLIPVVAAALPLGELSTPVAMLAAAVPIGVGAVLLAPSVGIERRALAGLGMLRLQLAVAGAGAILGLAAYFAGAPSLWKSAALPAVVAAAVVAAAVEELVFRGVVQPALQRHLGRAGILLATALFAATVIGAGPVALVLVLVLAGAVFAAGAAATGAPTGAIAGHVALTLGASVVWPAVLGPSPAHALQGGAIVALVVLIAAVAAAMVALPARGVTVEAER